MQVNKGDRLRLRLPALPPPGDQPVILDIVELEPIPEPIAAPSDAMDQFDRRSTAPAIVVEREFLGHGQLKNVDVIDPVGRIEGISDELELSFDSACEGWEK